MNIDALGFLDTDTGLTFCGDDEEFYAEVLQGYIDGDRSDELDKLFDVQDWKGYQIAINAVKSTSKTIGAMDMSEKAKALEQACKDMDAAYITEKHKAVMEEYRDLIEKIKNAL